MRIDNAKFTGSALGSQANAELTGSFTGSGHIELANTASYNFASASISASSLILYRGSGITDQTASLEIIASTSDTASYVSSSNVDGPFGFDSIITSSYAVSASHVEFADSASYSVTASHAITASYITSSLVDGPFGLDSVKSASYALTASYIEIPDAIRSDFAGVTTHTVTHGLGTDNIVIQVYDTTVGAVPEQIQPDAIKIDNNNQVTIDFAVARTGYVVITGGGFLRSGSIKNAQTASYVARVNNALSQGSGIEAFTYDGFATQIVQLDTSSAHFTDGVDKARNPDTASFVTGSVIVGFTQSFRLGDATSYENYLASASYSVTASHALTASFVEGSKYTEAVTSAVATTHNIVHNLNDLFPIVQTYNNVQDQVIPDTINIVNANQVDVTYAGAFTGTVVVKK